MNTLNNVLDIRPMKGHILYKKIFKIWLVILHAPTKYMDNEIILSNTRKDV
jgi:hypothetical protein